MKQDKRIPGQIMLVTLVTLMILGIITVSVVTSTRKDVQQTINTREYEGLFASSEEAILTIIDHYGKTDSSGTLLGLAGIASQIPADLGSCGQEGLSFFRCNFKSLTDPLGTDQTPRETQVDIKDLTEFDEYELLKDQSLTLELAGYRDEISFSWDDQAAMDLGLLYVEPSGEYKMIRDIFDTHGIFDRNGGDPITDPQGIHSFPFQIYNTPKDNGFSVRIANVTGLPANATPKLLTVTARTPNDIVSVFINFEADSGLQAQMREITATSYNTNSEASVTATARTLVPLHPQSLSLLEYVLLVNGPVVKAE